MKNNLASNHHQCKRLQVFLKNKHLFFSSESKVLRLWMCTLIKRVTVVIVDYLLGKGMMQQEAYDQIHKEKIPPRIKWELYDLQVSQRRSTPSLPGAGWDQLSVRWCVRMGLAISHLSDGEIVNITWMGLSSSYCQSYSLCLLNLKAKWVYMPHLSLSFSVS